MSNAASANAYANQPPSYGAHQDFPTAVTNPYYMQPAHNPGFSGGAQSPPHADFQPNAPPPQAANCDVEAGRQLPPGQAPPSEGNAGKYTLAFSEASIRAAFIRKVFALVGLMLAIVGVIVALPFMSPAVYKAVNTTIWAPITAGVVFLVLYIAIICVERLRYWFPINVISCFALAVSLGYLFSFLCTNFTADSVLLCFCLLVVSCGTIIIFSLQVKFDITCCAGIAILLSLYLFWCAIFSCGFIFWYGGYWAYQVYGCIAGILFMIYLAIDIQLLMGGHRMSLSPEEYIFASVQIFIDIMYIFLILLRLFGRAK